MTEKNIKCEFCGYVRFNRTMKETALCVILEDENGNMRDDEIEYEDSEYIYSCANCRRALSKEESP